MTIIPTPQQIVASHRSLLRLAVEALRRGTVHALEYADWQDEPVDRALAPSLVRKGAKRYLVEKNQDVENEEDIVWDPEFLSNLGLALTAPGVQIRILRSAPGDMLPVPGHSQARQEYYTQMGLFDGEEHAPGDVPPPVLRLVLHWGTDEDYNLDRVWLGCPKAGGETRESVKSHWDEPVWRKHSLLGDGQAQAEVTDLDIYLDGEATGSAG
jgi:hypothetical protein